MSHLTFTFICRELAPQITITTRETIELGRRVAVTIWRLATNVEYRTLGELFGLGHSTVGKIVLETCEAIAQHLLQVHMCFPTDQTLKQVIHGCDAKSGFPQVASAIKGTHISIIQPQANATEFSKLHVDRPNGHPVRLVLVARVNCHVVRRLGT